MYVYISGKVYKGILSNKEHVAIKHIIKDGKLETFVREVTSLSHIKHPNLVRLVGYSSSRRHCFLIYELCPNGNLANWLFGMFLVFWFNFFPFWTEIWVIIGKDKVLPWTKRLEIAVGSARGLQFLHTYSEGCIVHRDIKVSHDIVSLQHRKIK